MVENFFRTQTFAFLQFKSKFVKAIMNYKAKLLDQLRTKSPLINESFAAYILPTRERRRVGEAKRLLSQKNPLLSEKRANSPNAYREGIYFI
jgi:hypothetical protein